MSKHTNPTGEQIAAARLRAVLDAKLGRDTPERIWRLAGAHSADNNTDTAADPPSRDAPETEPSRRGNKNVRMLRARLRNPENGNAALRFALAKMLQETGETEEAEHWYRQAANDGMPLAQTRLAALLDENGETEEAKHWYRQAANQSYSEAEIQLAALLERQGDRDEAENWLRRGASRGDPAATVHLSAFLDRMGRFPSAKSDVRQIRDSEST